MRATTVVITRTQVGGEEIKRFDQQVSMVFGVVHEVDASSRTATVHVNDEGECVEYKIKVPGGYWFVSGEEHVCLDLDHPINSKKSPDFGAWVGLVPIREQERAQTLWGMKDSFDLVDEVGRFDSSFYCQDWPDPYPEDAHDPEVLLMAEEAKGD